MSQLSQKLFAAARRSGLALPLTAAMLLLAASPARALEPTVPGGAKEQELIAVLKSDAPAAEKAITCKRLVFFGTKDSVPALAPLLLDESLTSWARTALEAIPGPASDAALRDAAKKAHGRVLVGILNSIGARHDGKAVGLLAGKLKDEDAQVASAAAVALGQIGGSKAARALNRALTASAPAARPAVAEGAVRCAEHFLNSGKLAAARKLYDATRQASVPKQKLLEATRGAILARQAAGIPLLLEQLRSPDKAFFSIGLRAARELAGPEATAALVAELRSASAERQPLLLLALADREDPAANPTILAAAKSGSTKMRLVAIGVLERIGNVSSVPVLLEGAIDSNAEIAKAAMGALVRLQGTAVDSDVLARLPNSEGKTRQVLLELTGRRGMESAVPTILKYGEDPDQHVRSAAIGALGIMGGENQVPALIGLLQKTQAANDRADIETALLAISGRRGTVCVPPLMILVQNTDPGLRVIALHALAGAGGADALGAVRKATQDQEESVQDEAVRTLSSWPNTWPEDAAVVEPLLALAKASQKTIHQVLALRGYLQFLHGDKKIGADDKVTQLKDVLSLVQRPEEKRQAIGMLRDIPTTASLDVLVGFAGESAVADDACSALANITKKEQGGIDKEARKKGLRTIAEKSGDDVLKDRANELLKAL